VHDLKARRNHRPDHPYRGRTATTTSISMAYRGRTASHRDNWLLDAVAQLPRSAETHGSWWRGWKRQQRPQWFRGLLGAFPRKSTSAI